MDLPHTVGLGDMAAAEGEAPRAVVEACLIRVVYLMEPDMEPDRLKALVEYISVQGWSAEQLAHAADVLPRDQKLDEKIRYGGRITPADFERVIMEVEEVLEKVKVPMDARHMRLMIQLEPALSREDFEQLKQPHNEGENPFILKEEALNDHFDETRTRQ